MISKADNNKIANIRNEIGDINTDPTIIKK